MFVIFVKICMMITVKLNHEKLAIALLMANTVRDAAEQYGISEGHAHRIRKEDAFRKVLRDKREALFSLTNDRAFPFCVRSRKMEKSRPAIAFPR
jgi:hypothetical protein